MTTKYIEENNSSTCEKDALGGDCVHRFVRPDRPSFARLSKGWEWLRNEALNGNEDAAAMFIEMDYLRNKDEIMITLREYRELYERYKGLANEYQNLKKIVDGLPTVTMSADAPDDVKEAVAKLIIAATTHRISKTK